MSLCHLPAKPLSKPASISPNGTPRLLAEHVPSLQWGTNLQEHLKGPDWVRLRRACSAPGSKCEICGGIGRRHPVEAHEVWNADPDQRVLSLVRVAALCPSCHDVKHIGRTLALGFGQRAMAHLAHVNGWTMLKAREHIDAIEAQWRERSAWAWTLNLDWLTAQGITPTQARG